ncbi:MAG: alkane 1-monooxygenase [Proteobacteria bacterium]|nr:alkane 1-monooxygenase [Pseudomonadota bacterium]
MPGSAKDLRFLLAVAAPSAPVVGWLIASYWYTFLVFFGLVPLLDWLIGRDDAPSPGAELARLERSAFFRAILVAYVPLHLGLIVWGATVAGSGELAPWQALGLTLSVGLVTGGTGITIAHELGHKRSRLERWLARALLYAVSYGHFTIEHNRGHHQRVATREDPASARYGESYWAFLPRTVAGSYAHAWRLESARLAPLGLRWWHWRNEMLWATLLPPAFAVALGAAFGPLAAAYFFGQSAMAIALLEAVNYVEHYGLERARLPDGRYEPVSERHSWDANQVLTNSFLVHLQRHADHHLNPMRPYAALQPRADSPKLPTGYTGMLPLAAVPPLWFAVMNPRVPKGAG